ncbi:MAG: hypothetical protein MYY08_15070 [Mixta sp.]|nr:hypothetical protein [Mixta sp.]
MADGGELRHDNAHGVAGRQWAHRTDRRQRAIARLRQIWRGYDPMPLPPEDRDLFDRDPLEAVLTICRRSASLSEAGRKLFAVSRQQKKQSNDADRLRKYLARFDLSWEAIQQQPE